MLGALSLLGLALGLGGNPRRVVYVVALTLLIGATAAGLGLTSTSKARRSGTSRPRGAIGGIVLGFVGLVFSLLALAAFIAFWPQLTQLSDCMAGANTLSAQQACQNQFNNSVGNEFGLLQGNG